MQILWIGLAIFHAVVLAQAQKMSRPEQLNGANTLRSFFAKLYNIANMNELAYDKSLEKFAKLELTKQKCPLPQMIHVGDIDLVNLHTKESIDLEKFEAAIEAISDPGRTRMAVVEDPCRRDAYVGVMDTNDKVLMLNGEPGSRCPESRPYVHNGLCGVLRGYKRKQHKLTNAELHDVFDELRKALDIFG